MHFPDVSEELGIAAEHSERHKLRLRKRLP